MTVILVFPQSSGGFWGGVTECGLGSTRSTRNVAKSCAPQHRSGTSVGGEPVSTTVVDNQSTKAARGSPAADPILEPAPAGILGAPTDESTDDTAVSATEGGPDLEAGADRMGKEAEEAEVFDSSPNGSQPEPIQGADASSADAQGADAQGVDDENHANLGNLEAEREPPAPDGRPTDVTATLSETDVLLEDATADEALAPDTSAASGFDAEEPQTAAVWDAADVVTEIYHGHYNQLVRLAVLLVHDVQTAEEVVQDAFEAMHLAWRRLRDSEKALQYLRQTVVNRSRSVLRHRKVVDMHAPKPAPDEPSAEHAALALLERSAVAAALRSLPERQREAIALRYYADFSEADIAKAMGISKGAVKSHTARAMSSLKTILSQETP
jgi:RNA polymerase sigma-70 factor (sigma-E family)